MVRSQPTYFQRQWTSLEQAGAAVTAWDTGVDVQLLRHIANKSVAYPEGFVSTRPVQHGGPVRVLRERRLV